jgi:hypothetical protein
MGERGGRGSGEKSVVSPWGTRLNLMGEEEDKDQDSVKVVFG